MKKLFFTALILTSFCNAPQAAASSWKDILDNVTGALSSTNPASQAQKPAPEQKAAAKPEEKIAMAASKPKASKKIPTVNDVLRNENRVIVMPEPPIDEGEERLAPNTKKLIDKIPGGIGTQLPGKKKHLSIHRGDFEGDEEAKSDKEKPDALKAKMDITVSKKSPKEELNVKLNNALRALSAGQYEASIALYKEVLSRERGNYDALFGLATAYQKSGQRTQARVAYANLFSEYPNDVAGLNNFLVLAAKEAPEDALVELNKLAVRNPDFPSIYSQKALILSKMGDKQNAISDMAKALSLNPKSNIYRYNLAVMLDDAGNYTDAAAVYQQLLDENYRGRPLPVKRSEIVDRLTYITNNPATRN